MCQNFKYIKSIHIRVYEIKASLYNNKSYNIILLKIFNIIFLLISLRIEFKKSLGL